MDSQEATEQGKIVMPIEPAIVVGGSVRIEAIVAAIMQLFGCKK